MIQWFVKWWVGVLLVWSMFGLIAATLDFSYTQSCLCVDLMGKEWTAWCHEFQQNDGWIHDNQRLVVLTVLGPLGLYNELATHWPYCQEFTVGMVWQ